MSDKCQIYGLNNKISVKGSAPCSERALPSPCFSSSSFNTLPASSYILPTFPVGAFLLFVHAVCSFLPNWHSLLHLASSLILPVSCSAGVSFTFFTSLFPAGAYHVLLTASAVRYLHCLLVWDILPQWCEASGLFSKGPRSFIITCCLVWVGGEVELGVGVLWLKCVWPGSNGFLRSVFAADGWSSTAELEPKRKRQKPVSQTDEQKACCCIHTLSQVRLVSMTPQGGTHSLIRKFSHSSRFLYMQSNINLWYAGPCWRSWTRFSALVSLPRPIHRNTMSTVFKVLDIKALWVKFYCLTGTAFCENLT